MSQKRFHSQEESDGIPNKNKNKRFQPGHLPTSPLPIQESFQSQHLFPFSRVPDSIENKFFTASLQSHFQRLSSAGSLRQTSFFWSSSLGLAIDTNQRQAGTNVLDSVYRRLEYLSEFLKSKPFDHHHRSVIKAALLHSFSSACPKRPVRLELLNINPLITRGQRSLLQSSSSALHCYFNVINPSRHFSSVAPPTQFSQSAPVSRFYKPVDPPFPF